MRTPSLPLILALCLAPAAAAAGPGAPATSAAPRASASAPAPRPATSGSGALPAGHPPVEAVDPHGDLPPGHPAPHGDGNPGRPRMPSTSRAQEDASLPAGTIVVEVRDGENGSMIGHEVTLGIVENSVAKGESRRRLTAKTDGSGQVVFQKLDTASVFAYRVSVVRDGATYAAPPFNLPTTVGMKATIFAHPVTLDVGQATVASQGIIYLELRDEVLQVEQAYRIYNLGSTTWFSADTQVRLPEGFKAFTSQRGMSDLSWDGTPQGARFRGSVSPGMHDSAFRFQLPYPTTDEATLDVGILPHVQAFRVIIEAPKGLQLEVDGFPPARQDINGQGQRILFTEKETAKLDPGFRSVRVRLTGLPTKPRGRWYALAAALGILAVGLVTLRQNKAATGHDPDELKEARKRLLDELEQLEKDRASGEVGPKTYEAARRTLLDALARVLVQQG